MILTGTVLVASGVEENLSGIASWLSRAGFRVQAVRKGGEALLAILEERIRIAIIDLELQDLPGLDVVTILRKFRPALPIIVLSADESLEMGRRIFAQGIYYYLLKPIDLAELEAVVRSAMERRGRAGRRGSAGRAIPA